MGVPLLDRPYTGQTAIGPRVVADDCAILAELLGNVDRGNTTSQQAQWQVFRQGFYVGVLVNYVARQFRAPRRLYVQRLTGVAFTAGSLNGANYYTLSFQRSPDGSTWTSVGSDVVLNDNLADIGANFTTEIPAGHWVRVIINTTGVPIAYVHHLLRGKAYHN